MKKDEYEIRMGDGSFVQVSAWLVESDQVPPLIVHRDVEYVNQWTVSEPRSGGFVCRLRSTRKGAIEDAVELVRARREEFDHFVEDLLKKYQDRRTKYYADRCE
jgi:hypothetical protein